MSRQELLRLAVALAAALSSWGCVSQSELPGPRSAAAVSSFVVWSPAVPEPGAALDGAPVDVVKVRGGELLRLEARDDRPVQLGERLDSGAGFAESWSSRIPTGQVLFLRTSAVTEAVLLPRAARLRAYIGHGSDPGYDWFALEQRVVEWARGPLPAPFPPVATAQRVDDEGLAALDRVLADAVTHATREVDRAAARAVRLVAGLRMVRALRPVTGLPYSSDFVPEPVSATDRNESGGFGVRPGQPFELRVSGPALLHVWLRPSTTARGLLSFEVREGSRERARSVRRALVHVPPGMHEYRVESSTEAILTSLVSKPIVHLEDNQEKDEATQLARAERACEPDGSAPVCAIALSLLGLDASKPAFPELTIPWERALSASTAETQRVANALTGGLLSDRALALGRAGAQGDAGALGTLSAAVDQSVDDGARSAWAHASTHGTEWRVPETLAEPRSWVSTSVGEQPPPTCAMNGVADLPEVSVVAAEYKATPWHGVQTVELLVTSECSDAGSVALMVDGQRLVGTPSAPLVRWHVRVRGQSARIQRLDHSHSRVLALRAQDPCSSAHWQSLRAAKRLAQPSVLHFDALASAVGMELWLRSETRRAEVRVAPLGPPSLDAARFVAARGAGLTAYDERGQLWTRVARVPLPGWAEGGVIASGSADVAVRPIVRAPLGRSAAHDTASRMPTSPAPLSEAALVTLTRRILETPLGERGQLYLQRGLRLAAGGARAAALADAQAAQALGALPPGAGDAAAWASAAVQPLPPEIDDMPQGVAAYGVDPDFDDNALKCQAPRGPRADLEREFGALGSARTEHFDPEAAVGAAKLHDALPLDPRSSLLLTRSLSGSRWRLRSSRDQAAPRIRAEKVAHNDGPIDGNGRLRPRVAVGAPFESGTYATVLPSHPAGAVLTRVPLGTQILVEVACAARDPASAERGCPLDLVYGKKTVPVRIGEDGRGRALLPNLGARVTRLVASLRDEPGEWTALVRIVADRALPGTTPLDDSRWVIAPKATEMRLVLQAGASLTVPTPSGTLVRIEAHAESASSSELVLVADGRELRPALTGAPTVVPVAQGPLTFSARGGPVSFTLAERVPLEQAPGPQVDPGGSAGSSAIAAVRPKLSLVPNAAATSGWRRLAEQSPVPLSPFQSAIGTLVAETGAAVGRLRPTSISAPGKDAYVYALAGYRRQIESLGLWTRFDLFGRARAGEPTYGVEGSLYEDLPRQHLRLTLSFAGESQQVAGLQGKSLLAHGFAEYSYRAASNFFMLPRLGYDGMYSTIARRPTTLAHVDDEVYSPYRARRPTFVFLQGLFWYAPFFNEILYLRVRGTADAKSRALSHCAAASGAFFAFGDLDLSGQAQTIWYLARDSLSGRAHVDTSLSASARYSVWSGLGSFAVIPGASFEVRPQDSGWQLTASIEVLASYRRGLRDFSSLELDFPEQLSGGIPWRGSTPGGYR